MICIPALSTSFCNTEKKKFHISRAALGSTEGNSFFLFSFPLLNFWLLDPYIQVSLEEWKLSSQKSREKAGMAEWHRLSLILLLSDPCQVQSSSPGGAQSRSSSEETDP